MGGRDRATAKADDVKSGKSVSRKGETDFSCPVNTPLSGISFLQRSFGNQAVQRLFESGMLQARLRIGRPHDIYEQEADRVAEQVMRMPEKDSVSASVSVSEGNNSAVQMKPG